MEITASEMGKRGAKAKYAGMSPEQRKEAASAAAHARWARTTPEERSEFGKRIRAGRKKKAKSKKKKKR